MKGWGSPDDPVEYRKFHSERAQLKAQNRKRMDEHGCDVYGEFDPKSFKSSSPPEFQMDKFINGKLCCPVSWMMWMIVIMINFYQYVLSLYNTR